MENTLKEKSLQHETATITVTETRTPFSELDENIRLAIACANDKKAVNTVVLDLREIASFTEFFVITGGTNQRQVQAIADEIQEQLKKQLASRPIRIEGYNTAEWILLDYGDFIAHVFDQKSREFYDLERLWRDARKVEIPTE